MAFFSTLRATTSTNVTFFLLVWLFGYAPFFEMVSELHCSLFFYGFAGLAAMSVTHFSLPTNARICFPCFFSTNNHTLLTCETYSHFRILNFNRRQAVETTFIFISVTNISKNFHFIFAANSTDTA